MECFENWLDSVHKASWPPQVGIQCMILFLVSELLGQASPVQRGHYLCFWTAWRGNSHHSGQNNPLQFLNGGDCLSMEHKFNRWLPTFHLILWLFKLCSLNNEQEKYFYFLFILKKNFFLEKYFLKFTFYMKQNKSTNWKLIIAMPV